MNYFQATSLMVYMYMLFMTKAHAQTFLIIRSLSFFASLLQLYMYVCYLFQTISYKLRITFNNRIK